MLRARALQERSQRFVCAFCQLRVAQAVRPSNRICSTEVNAFASLRSSRRLALTTWRSLSTSTVLRAPESDKGTPPTEASTESSAESSPENPSGSENTGDAKQASDVDKAGRHGRPEGQHFLIAHAQKDVGWRERADKLQYALDAFTNRRNGDVKRNRVSGLKGPIHKWTIHDALAEQTAAPAVDGTEGAGIRTESSRFYENPWKGLNALQPERVGKRRHGPRPPNEWKPPKPYHWHPHPKLRKMLIKKNEDKELARAVRGATGGSRQFSTGPVARQKSSGFGQDARPTFGAFSNRPVTDQTLSRLNEEARPAFGGFSHRPVTEQTASAVREQAKPAFGELSNRPVTDRMPPQTSREERYSNCTDQTQSRFNEDARPAFGGFGDRAVTEQGGSAVNEQAKPAFGRFSNRRATEQMPSPTSREGSSAFGGFSNRPVRTLPRVPLGSRVMTEPAQPTATPAPPSPATGGADFWNELDARVLEAQRRRQQEEAERAQEEEARQAEEQARQAAARERRKAQDEAAPAWGESERPRRRSSRYSDEDGSNRDTYYRDEERGRPRRSSRYNDYEDYQNSFQSMDNSYRRDGRDGRDGRKGKRRSRATDTRVDESDWDYSQVERWERKQRQKAEKRAAMEHGHGPKEPEILPVFLPEFISISSLSKTIKQPIDQFLFDLEEMGFESITADTIMTGETASLIVSEYGFEPTVDTGSQRDLRPRPPPEDVTSLPERPPVVTIMGHVDHGKTTLLDWLRKSSVAAQEHGGITQHIGAFIVKMSSGKPITFLDTPGHAAFLSMRQRGANVTDIVVLVVAADDSVMPQTIEALKHATAAKVPIIVAISKVDKADARIDQVKSDLSKNGVEIEDFGGDVQVVPVSGKTGQGMDDLEESIVTLSEILDVRAEIDGMAEGWVLESSVKTDGKVATVLVKRGTLRLGDLIVAGQTWARIRVLRNEAGVDLEEAQPGTPVEILGWRELPEAGEQVLSSPDENTAKIAVDYRKEMAERERSGRQIAAQEQQKREKAAAEAAAAEAAAQAAELEDAAAQAALEPEVPGVKYQNITVRADVAGSVEAVCGTVQEIGNHEVQTRILRSQTGPVSEYDVDHAAISNSVIINFNTTVAPHIKRRAEEAKVKILDHTVIYHLVDEVKSTLSELLPARESLKALAEADILQVFAVTVKKRVQRNIAGCRVRNGVIKKNSQVKVLRRGEVVYDGRIDTLRHGKKEVNEMGKGTECGIGFDGFEDFREDDQIQTYEVLLEKRSL